MLSLEKPVIPIITVITIYLTLTMALLKNFQSLNWLMYLKIDTTNQDKEDSINSIYVLYWESEIKLMIDYRKDFVSTMGE